MKLLPKQLKQNRKDLFNYYFMVSRDGDGQPEITQGYCELTGRWSNLRFTITAVDFGEMLVDRSFAILIEGGELTRGDVEELTGEEIEA